MRVSKGFVVKLFAGANIQRWNDKIRPAELTELDEQAHKMIIAYLIGKHEESTPGFDWIEIIEGGIFELLQRIQVTDLKSQIFYAIKADKNQYHKLNEWVYDNLFPVITPLGRDFKSRFRTYLAVNSDQEDSNINRKIINAAHVYASRWEYDLIEPINIKDFERAAIRGRFEDDATRYRSLEGFRELGGNSGLKTFTDLCGYLRFQTRWNSIRRVTQTSVLGHMLIVAILSYLYSVQANLCRRRRLNNYFTGLFHDFPEALTKDIVSPVRGATEGIPRIISVYQDMEMTKVLRFLPRDWHKEIKLFTRDEFENSIEMAGARKKLKSIGKEYDKDQFNPRDGKLVKACDDLAAFTEAHLALRHGVNFQALSDAKYDIRNKYNQKENRNIVGLNFAEILADYED